MKITDAELLQLTLQNVQSAPDVECPMGCTKRCRVWTVDGLGGYIEACREHARDVMGDTIEADYRMFNVVDGKLVEKGAA